MSLATPEDVLDRWPEGTPEPDRSRLQVYLEDAETILWASASCDLEEVAEESDRARGLVVLLEVRMVVRALTNPAVARGIVREQIGDTAVSYVSDTSGLGLADADRDLLSALCGDLPGALVSVRLGRERPEEDEGPWWDFLVNPEEGE